METTDWTETLSHMLYEAVYVSWWRGKEGHKPYFSLDYRNSLILAMHSIILPSTSQFILGFTPSCKKPPQFHGYTWVKVLKHPHGNRPSASEHGHCQGKVQVWRGNGQQRVNGLPCGQGNWIKQESLPPAGLTCPCSETDLMLSTARNNFFLHCSFFQLPNQLGLQIIYFQK